MDSNCYDHIVDALTYEMEPPTYRTWDLQNLVEEMRARFTLPAPYTEGGSRYVYVTNNLGMHKLTNGAKPGGKWRSRHHRRDARYRWRRYLRFQRRNRWLKQHCLGEGRRYCSCQ